MTHSTSPAILGKAGHANYGRNPRQDKRIAKNRAEVRAIVENTVDVDKNGFKVL
jgi:hypothetical protein